MKIGINAYEANVAHRVGSNQYAYQVLVQLERLLTNDTVTVYLPSKPLADMPKQRKGWKYRVIGPAGFWSLWRLPIDLYVGRLVGRNFNVFLSLGHYAPRFSPFKSVICIMDLAYINFPTFFRKSDVWKLTNFTSYSVKGAKKIIAISKHTKKDIEEHYKRKAEDIEIAYPGFEQQELVGSATALLKKLDVRAPYFVYVGTMQPRKNLVRLVKAFEMLRKSTVFQPYQLVLAGKVGWMSDELVKAVQHSPARKNIKMLGFVTEEQKLALYENAKASILVGLYEGFGIPALESISAGTLPVVSSTASLPEVVGDCGVLVDPYSVEDIARGMAIAVQYTLRDKEKFRKLAVEQLSKFSWEKTGETIVRVLYEVGGKR